MLKRIASIKNIRNFHNFSCTNDFTKRNVIYALNGSGKTNLSRFLRVFQQSGLNENYFKSLKSLEAKKNNLEIDFELIFNDNDVVSYAKPQLPEKTKILVYNKEFLDENISIEDFSKKTHTGSIQLGIIGKNELEIKKLTKEFQEIKVKGEKFKTDCILELSNKASELQKRTKGRITTFTEYLNYNNLKSNYIDNFINTEELKIAKKKFETINKIDDTDKISANLSNFLTFDYIGIKEIIFQSFKFEDLEKEIENHISEITKSWIKSGLDFHKNENKNCCPFCRQSTSNIDIIRKYNEFIESKKSKTIDIIDGYIKNITSIKTTIEENQKLLDNGLTLKINMYIELFRLAKESFNTTIKNDVVNYLDTISSYLILKKKNLELLFIETENKEIEDLLVLIPKQLESISKKILVNNSTIKLINVKISDTGTQKSELRKQMAQWALIEYFTLKKQELETLRDEYKRIEKLLDDEKAKSPQKEKKELIIKLLKKTLSLAGLNKYTVNEDFHLILNVANSSEFDISESTNLVSDGEKTVIAFAYYFASILQEIEKFDDLANITLIVDDPISSTSYNYLHGIGVVLKNMNVLFQEVLELKRPEVPQIIILTHNLQFYNLLISNIFKQDRDDKNKKNSIFYLYTKDGNPFLEIETQNKKLSEYMTSLGRVYKFSKGELDENIGNDLRKVIETICSFNFLSLCQQNLEHIFDQKIETNLKLIADDYVHTDFNNYEDPLPYTALKDASAELLALIEKKYEAQYKQIVAIYSL